MINPPLNLNSKCFFQILFMHDIYQLHYHYLFSLIISHALYQCDVANVTADYVRKRGCECDVVVMMSGEDNCSLGTKSTIPHPFLTSLYFDTLFFYLHQSINSSLLWNMFCCRFSPLWVFIDFYTLYCCIVSTVGLACKLRS